MEIIPSHKTETPNKMRILVTGGAGFVGYNLISALIKRDDVEEIISLDNYSSGFENNHVQHEHVFYIKGNTWDIDSILIIKHFQATHVFHFGEFSRIVLSFQKVSKTFQSNGYGTQQVLEYCVQKNAKLIYSGSSAIFGEGNSDLSPYAWLKAKNIELIKNYEKWYNLSYSICYFYNAYGPRQIKKGEYATVIGIFEDQYKKKEPLTIVGDGLQTRIFTHIDDIVEGIIQVALYGNGDNYHLGHHKSISILDVAKMFNTSYVFIPERRGERRHSIMQESRAESELNWKAKKELFHDYISVIL